MLVPPSTPFSPLGLLTITKLPPSLCPLNFLPQQVNHTPRILGRERRTPSNNNITPCISGTLNSARSDATIYFDVQVGVSVAEVEDFGEAGGYTFLATESRFDCLPTCKYF